MTEKTLLAKNCSNAFFLFIFGLLIDANYCNIFCEMKYKY